MIVRTAKEVSTINGEEITLKKPRDMKMVERIGKLNTN